MMKVERFENGVLIETINVPDSDEAIKAELLALDLKSIRPIREYLASLPDAPQILKDREAAAVAARAKLGGG